MHPYDADYFERGQELGISGYSNYRWIPELTIPMCAEICERMEIPRGASILDFGCAKGFMVAAFRLLGRAAWGWDVSDYATKNAHEIARPYVWNIGVGYFDQELLPVGFMVAKDVLEHIDQRVWPTPRIAKRALVVVPLGDGEKYVIPDYERDVTHVHRQPLGWWATEMEALGWKVDAARYEWGTIKQNWVLRHPEGNGFLELSRP